VLQQKFMMQNQENYLIHQQLKQKSMKEYGILIISFMIMQKIVGNIKE